jgi:hypothetical protein
MERVTTQVPSFTVSHDATGLLPLTERILANLPGPKRLWKVLWGLLPVLHAVMSVSFYEVAGQNPYGWRLLPIAIAGNVVFSYALLHAMWGSAKIAREANALEPGLARLTTEADTHPFRGMESTRGPLVLALGLTLLFTFDSARMISWYAGLAEAPLRFLIYLPLSTWIWTYLMLMVGLNRLGKERLTLEAYCGDRSLGLRPVGKLAANGFWIFTANLAPILLMNVIYGLGLVVGLAFFLAGVIAFFLSLLGLHRQMLKVKGQQLARAQSLYAQAYEPLRFTPSLENLQKQSSLLSAAEALERRAEGIQTWPFSDAIFARIVVIATSVAAIITGRLILIPLGL